jgi:2-oxoglutarate/2-oxoacid ferredoxin oxidoreductase subunit alpha
MTTTTPGARAARPPDAKAQTRSIGLAVVGSGGDGVVLLGNLMLKLAARSGLYGVQVLSYGPQIRGGESAAVLRLSEQSVQYEGDEVDVLLCFRASDLRRFEGHIRLAQGCRVLLDATDTAPLPEWLGTQSPDVFRFPFARIENGLEVPGDPKNMLGFGLLCRMIGFDAESARTALHDKFGHRPDALARNVAAFDRGYAADPAPAQFTPLTGVGRDLAIETGNEAVARAAIEAGLGFFAGYPITPSSEIMETLLDEMPPSQGRVIQAEDEIAALGMVLGASFGGVPAMTATSGPGLSLMTEMMGLSSMAELPAVIVDCQRAGPATGMPSRTEQGDLFHAVFAGHGDFPRIVLGAFDVVHARAVTHRAFHLAETYQMPVLVLSDAYIAQRSEIHDPTPAPPARAQRLRWEPGGSPARFDVTDAHGVGAFRVPGTPEGTYLAAGIEHTLEGRPTADGEVHHQMNTKRFAKLDLVSRATQDAFVALGRDDATHGVLAWGSTMGVLREWIALHPDFRAFLPEVLEPFPIESFEKWRLGLTDLAVLELSFQGQLYRALAGVTDLTGARSATRSGGIPLTRRDLDHLLLEEKS